MSHKILCYNVYTIEDLIKTAIGFFKNGGRALTFCAAQAAGKSNVAHKIRKELFNHIDNNNIVVLSQDQFSKNNNHNARKELMTACIDILKKGGCVLIARCNTTHTHQKMVADWFQKGGCTHYQTAIVDMTSIIVKTLVTRALRRFTESKRLGYLHKTDHPLFTTLYPKNSENPVTFFKRIILMTYKTMNCHPFLFGYCIKYHWNQKNELSTEILNKHTKLLTNTFIRQHNHVYKQIVEFKNNQVIQKKELQQYVNSMDQIMSTLTKAFHKKFTPHVQFNLNLDNYEKSRSQCTIMLKTLQDAINNCKTETVTFQDNTI